ncbi:type IV pilus secretin PilQ [Paraferrimonas sp. SM1919]|uniref:type IV pilus secretin PilQ n=1 Tax=Paraferrimonas sp. SM1919 TaxID=2662263 RepID=UPI0013D5C723|nr:type IV pilus secretin PilQ family protein [Paraferrimonas sp. SM1919]
MAVLKCFTWLFITLMITYSPTSSAKQALTAVTVQGLIEGQLQLSFQFNQAIQDSDIKLDTSGPQITLKFLNTERDKQIENFSGGGKLLKQIIYSQQGLDLVAAIELQSLQSMYTKTNGKTFTLMINDRFGEASAHNKIVAIDFQSVEQQPQLKLRFENSQIYTNPTLKPQFLALDFYDTNLTKELLYITDVKEFATVLDQFETFTQGNHSRIEFNFNQEFGYTQQQQGNELLLTFSKKHKVATQNTFSGELVSLNFQDIPVRNVLQILANYNQVNLVASDSIEGNITLNLEGVPWQQALNLIMRIKGLAQRQEGNVLMIAPKDEFNAQEAFDLQAQQQAQEMSPLVSEHMQINYAKAQEIASLLKGGQSNMLSARGSVAVDSRTNTLLIQDTRSKINEIARLIKVLDVAVRQVVIESRMVTVKDDISEDLGIRWGYSAKSGDFATSGNRFAADDISAGLVPALTDRLNVNLPAAPVSGSPTTSIAFQVAKLADGTLLDLELSALEQESKGEVIASPRITTANQKSAYIEQGVEIPFVKATSSGATSVEFKKAVLGLTVTPHITPDNRIILDLQISQDSQGKTVDTPLGPATSIDTQRIGTQVLVDNGETLVLGGIYQQQIIQRVSKVPVLGDIPYLGALFRNNSNLNERREVLVFVTPRIVTEEF